MENKAVFLFDLDGVLIDTESKFDIIWKEIGQRYNLGIENFENKIKGATMPNIMQTFFGNFPQEVRDSIERDVTEYEQNMDIDFIPGAYEFLQKTKNAGIKMALVTSSGDGKLKANFAQLPIEPFFDTIVSADRITKGKPDPMPYLLAAADLNVSPEDCIVFEDSFNGIKSGNAAGARIIGLSTTIPAEKIEKEVYRVIPDFQEAASSDEMFRRFVEDILK